MKAIRSGIPALQRVNRAIAVPGRRRPGQLAGLAHQHGAAGAARSGDGLADPGRQAQEQAGGLTVAGEIGPRTGRFAMDSSREIIIF